MNLSRLGERNSQMSDPDKREDKKSGLFRWQRKFSFIGNDDDTDNPDFEKGSWTAFLFVLILLGIGIALMLMLAN